MKKLNLKSVKHYLSKDELKQINAGSGTNGSHHIVCFDGFFFQPNTCSQGRYICDTYHGGTLSCH